MAEQGMVVDCGVSNCRYNDQMSCMAGNISVGGEHAKCDTFSPGQTVMSAMGMSSHVANCTVESCKFNEAMKCMADSGIHVAKHVEHADCSTFESQ